MKRRDFLKYTTFLAATSGLSSCSFLQKHFHDATCKSCINPFEETKQTQSTIIAPTKKPEEEIVKELVKDERAKSKYFSQDFPDDIFLSKENYAIVKSLVAKLRIVERYVGHGNFNLLNVDSFYLFTNTIPYCKPITEVEKKFMEELFYFDAAKYGFKGDKTAKKLTDSIGKREVAKVPFSGHFLKKDQSLTLFQKVKRDVGKDLILTSGVRGVAKQFHLFLEKSLETKGNLSKASRSLAPPGYSFHYLGDFDVGKKNMGMKNFDQDFAETDEFKRLVDLGYINIRYTQSNTLGVRFEPWHLKV
ncbi:D-alanyl-D-alanine carboxypeptidase family protein [Halobacteriovorax sp. JY17]|uniref:D-alanyl-D-alanine carboxypeptidase family protein n=1 Tax=Halobacteriovorax sp. JY17 TaxID=2014617 RepID=UPI0025B94CBD|nr:D-alanyl-D-alanine carboxypeptidase family protein [Halobacteriovorax sp. JY17]